MCSTNRLLPLPLLLHPFPYCIPTAAKKGVGEEAGKRWCSVLWRNWLATQHGGPACTVQSISQSTGTANEVVQKAVSLFAWWGIGRKIGADKGRNGIMLVGSFKWLHATQSLRFCRRPLPSLLPIACAYHSQNRAILFLSFVFHEEESSMKVLGLVKLVYVLLAHPPVA